MSYAVIRIMGQDDFIYNVDDYALTSGRIRVMREPGTSSTAAFMVGNELNALLPPPFVDCTRVGDINSTMGYVPYFVDNRMEDNREPAF